jgi:hypothetical protein
MCLPRWSMALDNYKDHVSNTQIVRKFVTVFPTFTTS